MSENLDLVRSIYADWERGDFRSTEWADPEIECVIVGGPEPGSWTGLAGMRKGFRDYLSTWEGYRSEPNEYRELDGERVLVLLRTTVRGKTSGVQIDQMRANLFHFRGGKVIRLLHYWNRERALANLGLAE
jgi:ketosteroid isomerase-like protein